MDDKCTVGEKRKINGNARHAETICSRAQSLKAGTETDNGLLMAYMCTASLLRNKQTNKRTQCTSTQVAGKIDTSLALDTVFNTCGTTRTIKKRLPLKSEGKRS